MAGAPRGNQNAAKAKVWRAAIERALERRSISRADGIKEIDALADKLVEMAYSDLSAIKEFGDRMDGKPAQTLAGDPDSPLVIEAIAVRAVD